MVKSADLGSAPLFSQNYTSLVAQSVRDNKNPPGGSGILGPTANYTFNPADTKNSAFLRAYLDHNDVIGKNLGNKFFSQEEADVASGKIKQAAETGFSTNFSSGIKRFADDWVAKYAGADGAIDRGLISEDEAVTRNGLSAFVSRNPEERLSGTLNKSHLNAYPGSSGTQVG